MPQNIKGVKYISPKPKRVQISRSKGWRLPPNTVRVDGSTKWSNPFVAGEKGVKSRAQSVDHFQCMLGGLTCISAGPSVDEQRKSRAYILRHVAKLKGKDLACSCPAWAPCHADLLLALANGHEIKPLKVDRIS